MEECPQSGSGTSVDSSVFFGVVFIFGPRHWNDEPTSKSSAKMTFSFVPFSEYGKHTSAVVSWSASKTPDYFGKLGRRGKDACGIRENLKVCAASKSRLTISALLTKYPERFSDAALVFAQRSQINVASSALHVWHKRLATQQGAQAFAIQYARVQLQFRVLFKWRVQLRAHLKLFRQAKIAHKYFVMRRAWRFWVDRAEAHGREKRLREWNKGRVGKLFSSTSEQLTLLGAPCGLKVVLVLQVGRKRHLGYAVIDLQNRKSVGALMR